MIDDKGFTVNVGKSGEVVSTENPNYYSQRHQNFDLHFKNEHFAGDALMCAQLFIMLKAVFAIQHSFIIVFSFSLH